jgi:hypothetical protein
MTLFTTRTVGSLAYILHGSSGPGGSPINTFTHAKADFDVDSKLYPPYQISLAYGRSTSSTKTSFPCARGMSMCVICAYPSGVTSHPPIGSPAAASNPADTTLETVKT